MSVTSFGVITNVTSLCHFSSGNQTGHRWCSYPPVNQQETARICFQGKPTIEEVRQIVNCKGFEMEALKYWILMIRFSVRIFPSFLFLGAQHWWKHLSDFQNVCSGFCLVWKSHKNGVSEPPSCLLNSHMGRKWLMANLKPHISLNLKYHWIFLNTKSVHVYIMKSIAGLKRGKYNAIPRSSCSLCAILNCWSNTL